MSGWRGRAPGYTIDPAQYGSPNAYRVWKGDNRHHPERTLHDDTDLGFIVYVSDKRGWGVAQRVGVAGDGRTRIPATLPDAPFGIVYYDNPLDACRALEERVMEMRQDDLARRR